MKVVDFPKLGTQDIAAGLRNIADQIEAGDFGHATDCVVVLRAGSLDIFGLGAADATVTHYLLACAQHKMQKPMVDEL